ncbi:MAG: alpha/beta hydrolase [Tagaea sp.]
MGRFAKGVWIGLLSLVLAGCSALDMLDAITPSGGYVRTADVAFGGNPRQRLDVYAPRDAQGAPVVVFWYGGSWRQGDRGQYRFVAEALVREGYVVVLPDYRLTPEARFPDFVDDAALAVAWAAKNIGRYGGDPARIFAMGHSAGAYNAALAALDPRYLARHGAPPDAIKGVIGLSGPYDILNLRGRTIDAAFGSASTTNDAQPASFARPEAPRVLLIHGARDTLVPPAHAEFLAGALRAAGARADTRIYPDVAHIDMVLGLSSRLRGGSPLLADIAAFVAQI